MVLVQIVVATNIGMCCVIFIAGSNTVNSTVTVKFLAKVWTEMLLAQKYLHQHQEPKIEADTIFPAHVLCVVTVHVQCVSKVYTHPTYTLIHMKKKIFV